VRIQFEARVLVSFRTASFPLLRKSMLELVDCLKLLLKRGSLVILKRNKPSREEPTSKKILELSKGLRLDGHIVVAFNGK
jgi:hypothetical protein